MISYMRYIVHLLCVLLISCTHTTDVSMDTLDPTTDITFIYKDGTVLSGIQEIEYDEATDILHYTKIDDGAYILGKVSMKDVCIRVPDGYLVYDKIDHRWSFHKN